MAADLESDCDDEPELEVTAITALTLEVDDLPTARAFYAAFGVGERIGLRESAEPTSGFRRFTVSLGVSQPANADLLLGAAADAGARVLKPTAKSFWGYGGVIQAPDGAMWKVATSQKKNTTEPAAEFDDMILLLGAADVGASKRFYATKSLTVDKSFANRYVQFAAPDGGITLALYGDRALAKDAGVPADGGGSHRLAIHGDAGSFTDPDGFRWEPDPT